jgi:hypothetical protein
VNKLERKDGRMEGKEEWDRRREGKKEGRRQSYQSFIILVKKNFF